jgi:hypothetical protein
MRRLCQWFLAVALVAVLVSPALAQGRRGRGQFRMPGLLLLNQESVQKELKLTKDQIKEVKKGWEKQLQAFQGLQDVDEEERPKKMQEIAKDGDKAVAKILKKDQAKRLKEITLQIQGAGAFSDPEVVKALKITDDQKKKIKTIQDDAQKAGREAREDAAGDQEAFQKKLAEIRKDTNAKVMKVLTDDQKKEWKKMTGKKFEGKLDFFGRRRGQ